MTLPLLDPRNDLVFKMLFTNALPLLSDLINAVRYGEPPINVVSVKNPRLDSADLQGKFIVLDILAQDESGHFHNVEMQMSRREQWGTRSMVYMAKALAEQLKSGEPYVALKPVIGIHLLGYDLFDDPKQALWCFEMRDRLQPDISLGRELQINIVELPKYDKLMKAGGHGPSALAAWIAYFQHWKEDDIMNQIAYQPVQDALKHLRTMSDDEETRYLADMRERALMTERIEIEAALARGKLEGKEEGKAEGKEEGKIEGKIEGKEEGLAEGKAESLRLLIESGIPEAQARAILRM